MILLAPGTLLIAALLTVPPLIVFYLLKLRRRPMRVTSTMLWDQAVRDLEVNVPFRWIRPSWLLILHALILAALLIAVGRPAIENGGAGAGRVFLLIDHSASMSAKSGDTTRLDLAKKQARKIIESFSANRTPPEISVVAFAAEPVILGPPSRNPSSVVSLIDSIEPTDQPGDPIGALGLVRSLTQPGEQRDDEESESAATAIVISDGGGLSDRALSIGSARAVLEIVGEPEAAQANIGIVAFAAERGIDSPSSVRIFLRLLNTGSNEAGVPLVIRFDDDPIARRAVTIPAARAGSGSEILPGETAESFTLEIPAGGVLTISVERDDALAADNTVHAVLPPVRRPAVMLVVPEAVRTNQPALARDRADPLLLDVLEAIGTDGLRVVDRRRYLANQTQIAEQFGLVIFDRVRPAEMPPIPTISFGAPLPGSSVATFVRAVDAGRTPVLAWDRDHPVMRDVVLDTVVIADRLVFPEDDEPLNSDDPESAESKSRSTLARGDTGPLIVAIDDAGVQRITVAFSLDQSNWPVHFSFPIFVLSAFDFLVPGGDSGTWARTADPVWIDLPAGVNTANLDGPVARTIEARNVAADHRVPLGRLALAGLYSLDTGVEREPIALNLLDTEESRLSIATAGEAEELVSAGGTLDRGPREIWRWFVLTAGIALLLEWLVFTLKNRV